MLPRERLRIRVSPAKCHEEPENLAEDCAGSRFGSMDFGTLSFSPALEAPHLTAKPVRAALEKNASAEVYVSAIDPELADTAAFCDHYEIALDEGANCVIVEAKRGEASWYAACLVLGHERIDVNSLVRKHLGAKKVSFAPMDTAVELTGMQYGGITPIGLPESWELLIDESVAAAQQLIIGSGIRDSKILTTGAFIASLPGAEVMSLVKRQV